MTIARTTPFQVLREMTSLSILMGFMAVLSRAAALPLHSPPPIAQMAMTMMMHELHELCMSKAIPEAGIVMHDGLFEQRLYCNQQRDKLEKSAHPIVSFVDTAPVNQSHRILVPEKTSAQRRPPVIYILPPKVSNQYKVDFVHVSDNGSVMPEEPKIHFLSRDKRR